MHLPHRLIATAATLSACVLFPVLPSAGDDAAPLAKIIAGARSPLTLAEQAGEAEIEKRTRQYISDLETLEGTIASESGNLDLVIIVREEREAWQAGKPTPAIDPKDNTYPLELRKLRYYFEQDKDKLTTQAGAAAAKALPAVIDALGQAESALTKSKRIDDALAVRKERALLETELELAGIRNSDAGGQPSLLDSALAPAGAGGRVLQVTVTGGGANLTLDEALQQAQPGDTLVLNRGAYPASKVFPPVNEAPNYPVTVPKLRLIGNHASIPGTLAVLANDIEISGIRCETLQIGDPLKAKTAEKVTVTGCLYRVIVIRGGSKAAIHNSLGGLYLDSGSTGNFEHCTAAYWITGNSPRYLIHGFRSNSESRFEKCIIKGGRYLGTLFSEGPTEVMLIDCVVHADQFYGHHSPGGDKLVEIADPDDLKKLGFHMRNVRFEDPLFVNPEENDFRIKNDSPAKGQGFNEPDLGARLGADGWPVPLDTR